MKPSFALYAQEGAYLLREVRRVLRQYSSAVKLHANGRLLQIVPAALRIIDARLRYKIGPMYFSLYRLAGVPRREWANYITDGPSFKKMLTGKSPEDARFIANNKLAFYGHCIAHGLPTIPIVCMLVEEEKPELFGVRQVSTIEQWRAAMSDSPTELFVKPVDGTYGEGAFVVGRDNDRVVFDGQQTSLDQLFAILSSRLKSERGWIVQPRMRSHPSLDGILSPHGLATARVVTHMKDGLAKLFVADFKITVGHSVTDNFSKGKSGNLLAAIDTKTGALSTAWGSLRKDWPVMAAFPHHPDSGRQIEGFVLPFWDEMSTLALKGQNSLPTLRSVGWDIAATSQGVMLVEANSAYDVSILQIAHQRGLKRELMQALG